MQDTEMITSEITLLLMHWPKKVAFKIYAANMKQKESPGKVVPGRARMMEMIISWGFVSEKI